MLVPSARALFTHLRNDCAKLANVSWRVLRKGPASVHIAYAGTFTNNLRSYNTRIRTQPSIEISLDQPDFRLASTDAHHQGAVTRHLLGAIRFATARFDEGEDRD
jgi:hypothetical protein